MTKVLDKFFQGVEILMAILLAVMIIFMFTNVVLRFVFDTGFAQSEEIARLAFIALVYLGTIGAYRDNQHLAVDIVIEKLGPKGSKVLYVLIQLVVIWVMYLLVRGSITLAEANVNNKWVATQFPSWIVFLIGAATGVSIIVLALMNIVALIRGASVEELLAPRKDVEEDFEELVPVEPITDENGSTGSRRGGVKESPTMARERLIDAQQDATRPDLHNDGSAIDEEDEQR